MEYSSMKKGFPDSHKGESQEIIQRCLKLIGYLHNSRVYARARAYEWHVAHEKNLDEESKLIEAGFEHVRFSEKDDVAIYRKRK